MSDSVKKVNGHPLAELPEAMSDMVGIGVTPIGRSIDQCEGAIIHLSCKSENSIQKNAETGEYYLASGLSGPQCREIARQLLTIADAASNGNEVTMLCVTQAAMWKLPGQVLLARRTPAPHFEFAIKPTPANTLLKPQRKLIVP